MFSRCLKSARKRSASVKEKSLVDQCLECVEKIFSDKEVIKGDEDIDQILAFIDLCIEKNPCESRAFFIGKLESVKNSTVKESFILLYDGYQKIKNQHPEMIKPVKEQVSNYVEGTLMICGLRCSP